MKKLKIMLVIILIIEVGYFFYVETNDIVITTQEIQDFELQEVLGKLRVIQISDLHIKKIGSREKRLISLINKINPNIIFITGDFVSRNEGITPCIEVLKQITEKHLVVAIFGNSDHYHKDKAIDTELLVKGMEEIGMKVLVNESLKLTVKGTIPATNHSLYVVGLDDNYLWYDNIFKAMNNVPEDSPKILLAHCPNIIEKINTKGINLVLSGHSHGGQIVLPLVGALTTSAPCNAKKKFISGLYNDGSSNLYVNRGIGTGGKIPMRLFCKPEITLFKFNS